MFLDSLANDAAWLGRYARSRAGDVMPWSVVEQMIQDTHPYEVFMVSEISSPHGPNQLLVPWFIWSSPWPRGRGLYH